MNRLLRKLTESGSARNPLRPQQESIQAEPLGELVMSEKMVDEEKATERPGTEERFEIFFTRDERQAWAYNPCYPKRDSVREEFLRDLVKLSQKGGRARCWRCDNLSVEFQGVKTALGFYAVGSCEVCQNWFLM